jgi:hypothetical protein
VTGVAEAAGTVSAQVLVEGAADAR